MRFIFLLMSALLLIKREKLCSMVKEILTIVMWCPQKNMSCNSAMISDIDLWHQRLGHINHNDLEELSKFELVRGLPKL